MNHLVARLYGSASVWAAAYSVSRVATGLFTLPMATVFLNEDALGLYYLLLTIAGFAALLDFGLAGTVSRNAAFAAAGANDLVAHGVPAASDKSPNRSLLAELVSCSRYYYGAAAAGLFCILFLGTPVLERIAGDQLPFGVWLVFVIATCYNLATLMWPYLLLGMGHVREASIFGVILQLVQGGSIVGLLWAGAGLWAMAIAPLAGALIVRPLMKHYFFRKSGLRNVPCFQISSLKLMAVMWPMAWRQGVTAVGVFLLQRASIFLSATFLGITTTAQFGLTNNTLAIIFQIATIFLFVAIPRLSQLRVHGERKQVLQQFFLRTYGGLFAGVIATVVIVWFGPRLLLLIGAQTTFLPVELFISFAILAFADAHTSAYMQLHISSNNNPFVFPLLVSGCVQVILVIFLVPRFGIWSFVVSKVVVEGVFLWWWSVTVSLKPLFDTARPALPLKS